MKGMKHPSAPWLFFFLACCGAVLAVDLLVSCTPLPLSPSQRRDWQDDPTEYPPLRTAGPRDAGSE